MSENDTCQVSNTYLNLESTSGLEIFAAVSHVIEDRSQFGGIVIEEVSVVARKVSVFLLQLFQSIGQSVVVHVVMHGHFRESSSGSDTVLIKGHIANHIANSLFEGEQKFLSGFGEVLGLVAEPFETSQSFLIRQISMILSQGLDHNACTS